MRRWPSQIQQKEKKETLTQIKWLNEATKGQQQKEDELTLQMARVTIGARSG